MTQARVPAAEASTAGAEAYVPFVVPTGTASCHAPVVSAPSLATLQPCVPSSNAVACKVEVPVWIDSEYGCAGAVAGSAYDEAPLDRPAVTYHRTSSPQGSGGNPPM